MRTIALLLGFALASTLAVAQTMYTWVDKNGKTHYTDSPPPDDATKLAPPKGTTTRVTPAAAAAPRGRGDEQPAPRADGNQEGTQASFRPEEQTALRYLCAISLLERLTCQLELNRSCSLDELVKGIKGDAKKGLARDPRADANYDYRIDVRGDDVLVSAVPRVPGLAGFASDRNGTRYNPAGAAGAGDRKVIGGTNCPNELK